MNPQFPGEFGYFLMIVIWLFGVFASIFFMWVSYRAMRAHERIATSLEAPSALPPRSS